jgi:hypothetical protein
MNLGEAQMTGEDIIEAVDSIQLAFMEINIQLKYYKKPEIDFGNQIGQLALIKKQAERVSGVENATFLVTALNGTADHLTNMGIAFSKDKPIEGIAELSRACGTISRLIGFTGKWGGPLGIVISEIFSLFASILVGTLGPEPDSFATQLGTALANFAGDTYKHQLLGSLAKLKVDEVNLKNMTPNTKYWNADLYKDYVSGDEGLAWFESARSWLVEPTSQEADAWPYVFQGYFLAVQKYFGNLILVFEALKKIESENDQELVREGIRSAKADIAFICDDFENNFKALIPFARNHGAVWHVGTNNSLFIRGAVVGDWRWHELGGWSTRVSIGRNQRIWTVGSSKNVWTGRGTAAGNWHNLKFTADDISVVARAGSDSLTDVYTIEKGKLCWRVWDELVVPVKEENERFVPLPGMSDTKFTVDSNSRSCGFSS